MLDEFRLDGKVAIVTGARTGLGQAMAIAFAEAGADVVGVGRHEMPETERAVIGLGRDFLFIEADLSTIGPIQRVVDETIQRFGKIDILVNNAGMVRRADAIDFSEKDWDDVMNLNLKSVFFLSQAVAKRFIEQGDGGKIINIASMLSFIGGTRSVSYTASKTAVVGITKTMANAWADWGIQCNAIAPGYMETDMTLPLRDDDAVNKEVLSKIPANRWGRPDELKGAIIFLASRASDYVTGHTLCVDGGWMSR